ncbi:MAG: phage tail tape measure protein, partial [Chloroflexota bacterium]
MASTVSITLKADDNASDAIKKFSQELQSLSGHTQTTSGGAGGLGTAFQSLTGHLGGVSGAAGGAGSSMLAMAGPEGMVAEAALKAAEMVGELIGKLGELALKSIELATSFDGNLTNLRALAGVADSSSPLFQELGDKALEIGQKTQYSSDIAIKAMNELRNTGQDLANVVGESLPIAYLAEQQGAKDMNETAKVLGSTLNAMGFSANEASQTADIMGKAFQLTGLKSADLGAAIRNVGAYAKQMKEPFTELTSAIELQTKAGISASQAGINHRNLLMSFIKPTVDNAAAQKELGLQIYDSSGKFVGLTSVMAQVEEKTKGLNDQEKQQILSRLGNKNALMEYMVILNSKVVSEENGAKVTRQGADALKYYDDQLKNSKGTLEEMATIMRQSLEMQIKQLDGSIKELEITFGKAFLPGLQKVTEAFVEIANAATKQLKPVMDELTPKFTEIGQKVAEFLKPIFEDFINFVIPAFKKFAEFVIPIISKVIEGFQTAYQIIRPVLADIAKEILGLLGPADQAGKSMGDNLKAAVIVLAEALKGLLLQLDGAIKGFKILWAVVEPVIKPLMDVANAINQVAIFMGEADAANSKAAESTAEVAAQSEKLGLLTEGLGNTSQKTGEQMQSAMTDSNTSVNDLAQSTAILGDTTDQTGLTSQKVYENLQTDAAKAADAVKKLIDEQGNSAIAIRNQNEAIQSANAGLAKAQAAFADAQEAAKTYSKAVQGIQPPQFVGTTSQIDALKTALAGANAAVQKTGEAFAAASREAAKAGDAVLAFDAKLNPMKIGLQEAQLKVTELEHAYQKSVDATGANSAASKALEKQLGTAKEAVYQQGLAISKTGIEQAKAKETERLASLQLQKTSEADKGARAVQSQAATDLTKAQEQLKKDQENLAKAQKDLAAAGEQVNAANIKIRDAGEKLNELQKQSQKIQDDLTAAQTKANAAQDGLA